MRHRPAELGGGVLSSFVTNPSRYRPCRGCPAGAIQAAVRGHFRAGCSHSPDPAASG